jgi:hypothetical protein
VKGERIVYYFVHFSLQPLSKERDEEEAQEVERKLKRNESKDETREANQFRFDFL